MKQKIITAYFCEHCNKLYRKKSYCIEHEKRCHKNPDNYRPCFDCQHCQLVKSSIVEENPAYGEVEKEVDAFWCNKKKHYLIPPISRHKNGSYQYDFENCENLDMPTDCGDLEKYSQLPF